MDTRHCKLDKHLISGQYKVGKHGINRKYKVDEYSRVDGHWINVEKKCVACIWCTGFNKKLGCLQIQWNQYFLFKFIIALDSVKIA